MTATLHALATLAPHQQLAFGVALVAVAFVCVVVRR